jgi:hypothetical protein
MNQEEKSTAAGENSIKNVADITVHPKAPDETRSAMRIKIL